ncbi:reverse transcriptase domain-containing protein [Amycolatopsis sp. NPDC058986]|uniref:reverse transcriptase domain-containing protein n=1 Tax=unclassified Amycolatopsis TaxID=2618356 RepID=UPI00366F12D5
MNLVSVYERHVEDGSARGRDGVHPKSLSGDIRDVCSLLSKRIRAGDYQFTQYREHLILKGAKKAPRIISIPSARDRITLRALSDFLGHIYPMARGVIPQLRIQQVCEVLGTTSFDAFVRIDIKDFYPSIDHAVAHAALSKRIRKPEILKVIMSAIATPTVPDGARKRPPDSLGVPQGLAISNMVAELVASSVDEAMHNDERCEYFRFVDDVLLLCKYSDAEELFREVAEKFRQQGLEAHDPSPGGHKSSIGKLENGFDYLGYTFTGSKVSVRSSSVRNIEASIARSFTRYKKTKGRGPERLAAEAKCEFYVNLKITGCIHKGVARGWLHYFRQMNDLTLLKELDATVTRFQRRFMSGSGLQLKKFMRAYWAIRHPDGRHAGYIPNFDNWTTEKKHSVLREVSTNLAVQDYSDEEVEQAFERLIDKAVSELERDIGSVS